MIEIGGGAGELVSLDDKKMQVLSPKPFAPGAPMKFGVHGLQVEARSLGSKRQDDGRFMVTMRLVNLSRDKRVKLQEHFAAKH